jgi:hypothetical protein
LNMIRGSAEEGRYDDREGDKNPEGIDDGSQYLVDPNDQDNVGKVCNICNLLCIYTRNSKKSFINCLVSAYIALCLNDNHRDQQKSTRPEEADGGPVGYHGFRRGNRLATWTPCKGLCQTLRVPCPG